MVVLIAAVASSVRLCGVGGGDLIGDVAVALADEVVGSSEVAVSGATRGRRRMDEIEWVRFKRNQSHMQL